MPLDKKRKSLKFRLIIVLLAAVIIPSMVITWILARTGAERERQQTFIEMQAIAEVVSDDISEFMLNAQSILVTASLSHIYWVSRQQALNDLIKRFPFFEQLAIYDFEGLAQVVVRQKGAVWKPSKALIDQAIQEAMAGQTFTSDVQITASHHPLVFVAVPIRRQGEPLSEVLSGVVNLEVIEDMISKIRAGEAGYVFVVDQKGRVIAHPLKQLHLIGTDVSNYGPVREALTGKTDTGLTRNDIFTDPSGNRVAGFFHIVPHLNWIVIVQLPVREAFGSQTEVFATALAWALLFAFLFGLVGLFLVR
ncbi:MAG: cache domain-containing protein, partial [Armatimonadota bacterium]|nr:cache domain-containing protein [Armatimonadota bacterium]